MLAISLSVQQLDTVVGKLMFLLIGHVSNLTEVLGGSMCRYDIHSDLVLMFLTTL